MLGVLVLSVFGSYDQIDLSDDEGRRSNADGSNNASRSFYDPSFFSFKTHKSGSCIISDVFKKLCYVFWCCLACFYGGKPSQNQGDNHDSNWSENIDCSMGM